MTTLGSKQKRYLKAQAHHLKPLAQVGKNGITVAFAKEMQALLQRHELVKVKFNEFKDERNTLFLTLVKKVRGQQVAMVGNTGIVFKQNPEIEQRRYQLPTD